MTIPERQSVRWSFSPHPIYAHSMSFWWASYGGKLNDWTLGLHAWRMCKSVLWRRGWTTLSTCLSPPMGPQESNRPQFCLLFMPRSPPLSLSLPMLFLLAKCTACHSSTAHARTHAHPLSRPSLIVCWEHCDEIRRAYHIFIFWLGWCCRVIFQRAQRKHSMCIPRHSVWKMMCISYQNCCTYKHIIAKITMNFEGLHYKHISMKITLISKFCFIRHFELIDW